MRRFLLLLPLFGISGSQVENEVVAPWRADHHMHLASADLCRRVGECLGQPGGDSAVYGIDAVRALDEGNVERGVALSCAYIYALGSLKIPLRELPQWIRRENEFTAAEVSRYPDRLIGFMSVDPRLPSAIDEMEHWRGSTTLVGLKLHLMANGLTLKRADHRRMLQAVFRQASSQGIPIAIHIGGGKFDSTDAERFIREILPAAGDSWVQIAHAAGGLPVTNHVAVLRVFADHFARRDSAVSRVLFDISYVPAPEENDAAVARLAREMRRIGLDRFLFASDFNVLTPVQQVERLGRLHFTAAELEIMRGNCAPWACGPASRLGSQLARGMTLSYQSEGAAQPAWTIDSLTTGITGIPGAECVGVSMRRSPEAAIGPQERYCVSRDTLYRWSTQGSRWDISRPIGASMTWTSTRANGDTVRYETGALATEEISGQKVPVVETMVTTVDSTGRPKARLRERYAPGLLTAAGGVFEAPDKATAGQWTRSRGFELVDIRPAS